MITFTGKTDDKNEDDDYVDDNEDEKGKER